MSDRTRLAAFAAAVVAVFALGAGLGSIVGPIDAGSGHDDHPVTSTSADPGSMDPGNLDPGNLDMTTVAPGG